MSVFSIIFLSINVNQTYLFIGTRIPSFWSETTVLICNCFRFFWC